MKRKFLVKFHRFSSSPEKEIQREALVSSKFEASIYDSPNKWCNSFFIEQHQISVHIYFSELNLHKTLSIIFKSWGISSSIIHIAISQYWNRRES